MGRHRDSKPQPMVPGLAPASWAAHCALRSTLQLEVPFKGLGPGEAGPGGASQVHKSAVLIEKGKQLSRYLDSDSRRSSTPAGAGASGLSFTHVPRHCKIPGNERADEFAARGEPQAGEANLRCAVGRFENCGPPRSGQVTSGLLLGRSLGP